MLLLVFSSPTEPTTSATISATCCGQRTSNSWQQLTQPLSSLCC